MRSGATSTRPPDSSRRASPTRSASSFGRAPSSSPATPSLVQRCTGSPPSRGRRAIGSSSSRSPQAKRPTNPCSAPRMWTGSSSRAPLRTTWSSNASSPTAFRSSSTARGRTLPVPASMATTLPGRDSAPSDDVDTVAGARLATEHLIALGHRRIACVVFDLSFVAARERLEGYEAALRGAGIAVDEGLIVETGYRVGTHSIPGDLLGREDYTAIFAAADMTAAGVLGALRSAGRRVPDDTSLVGFDDIPLAEFLDPPLTTVRVPAVQVGEAVARALLDRLAGQTEVRRILLPVELMVRASSAPPMTRRQSGA